MTHDITRKFTPGPALAKEEPSAALQQIDPDRPLLHPVFRESFRWGNATAVIHAQRLEAGSELMHPNHFYLELPDGTFHEIQFSRLGKHLCYPPRIAATPAIALAFTREPEQSPELLSELAKACGINPATA